MMLPYHNGSRTEASVEDEDAAPPPARYAWAKLRGAAADPVRPPSTT